MAIKGLSIPVCGNYEATGNNTFDLYIGYA